MIDLQSVTEEQKKKNLESFRGKVRNYCRLAGKTQQALANELNYACSILSAKLSGAPNRVLTINDVKEIIKVLAAWEAINLKSEANELLKLRNLSCNTFSKEEWARPPLNKLEAGEIYNQILSLNTEKISAIAALINHATNDTTQLDMSGI